MSNTLMIPQAALYAGVELRRLWASRRGLMTLAATTMIWYFILRYAIGPAANVMADEGFQQMFTNLFGQFGLQQLFGWPAPELAIFWLLTLLLLPLFCLFFTANQISSDAQRGTLRLLSLRSSRLSILLGRFTGQLLVQGCLILVALSATLIMTAWRQGGVGLAELEAAGIIWLNLIVVLMPFTALMSCFSSLVNSSRLAVSLAIVSLGATFGLLAWLIFYFPDFIYLLGYLPGAQIFQLLPQQGWQSLQLATLPLLQTLVLLVIAAVLIKRKAL